MADRSGALVEFITKSVVSAVTRPANATTYTAGDVISDVTGDAHHTFSGAIRVGPKRLSGAISSARVTSSANKSALYPDLELWLFNADIAVVADNAAFAPTDAEMLTRIGIVDFVVADWKQGNAGADAAGNACCEVNQLGIAFQGAIVDIFGQLVVRNAYVPVASEVFTVELIITQD